MNVSLAPLFALALSAVAGCGGDLTPDEACHAVCDSDAECGDVDDASSCADLCAQFAQDDDAYGEAIVARADCYDQDLACNELVTCTQ